MIYLNEQNINEIGISWQDIIFQLENAVKCIQSDDFSQPIKPYLRYRNLNNRIIAMPAFIGGDFDVSGIKWIASFPDNITRAIPRAHSIVILNDSETGVPIAIINTPLLSIIRTAGVSGMMFKHYDKARQIKNATLGIIGMGPIGLYHLKLFTELYSEKISSIKIFDLNKLGKIDVKFANKFAINICDNWNEVYENSDIVITCTVSKDRYIDRPPKEGALLLNVSLRDYKLEIFDYIKNSIIVDDWDEVCRENTDIEMFCINRGLKRDHTKSIVDVICNNHLEYKNNKDPIMFNPMGLSVFDISVANYYYTLALNQKIGQSLI